MPARDRVIALSIMFLAAEYLRPARRLVGHAIGSDATFRFVARVAAF